MARAFQQTQHADEDRAPGEWQSLRQELVALLTQVDSQVARTQRDPAGERRREVPAAAHDDDQADRRRDALRSVQRAITRFEDPHESIPANPRDSLQAAISQIRARQGENGAAARQQREALRGEAMRTQDAALLEKLALSVGGLSGRLERIESDIKVQLHTGANVKDVADQVAQLAHVVELLAGAVGETGQVKRLEGQIAGLGKLMTQGREMDAATLTRRLDDLAATVGQLAELQVHFADKVQNPVETQAFQDGMSAIEQSVRSVYDRIDALERQESLSPADLEHVTAEMARFTEAMRQNSEEPQNLIELVDALNTRISDIESGDRLLHGLRKDLTALRDAVVVTLAPRFDALESRLDTLGQSMSTRDDIAELGRQIGTLGDRMGERVADPGLGQLEAQVRQLVARMDQTGEQLSGLAKLYAGEPSAAAMPDLDAMADMVALKTSEAVQRHAALPDPTLADKITGLEDRITAMLDAMKRDPEVDDFSAMQASIGEVNDRLKRLETSLSQRQPMAAELRASETELRPEPMPLAAAFDAPAAEPARAQPPRNDSMPRDPTEEAPLAAEPFPAPSGPVHSELAAKTARRQQHPGLNDDVKLADRYPEPRPEPEPEAKPVAVAPPATAFERPPAPQPSADFLAAGSETAADATPVAPVAESSRNTFIEAARRAAQRQSTSKPESGSNSLIGRALSRFQNGGEDATTATPRLLAGDKPARSEVSLEPMVADAAVTDDVPARKPRKLRQPKEPKQPKQPKAAPAEAVIAAPGAEQGDDAEAKGESFLLRHRRVILLAAATVATAFLALNLVAQHLAPAPEAEPAAQAVDDAPATTGAISGSSNIIGTGTAAGADGVSSLPPRVIPMVDSLKTGSIDRSAAAGFSAAPVQAMPSAFAAASDVASGSSASIAPLAPDASAPLDSPVKVELPPEGVGPMDLRQAAADGDARAQFEVGAIFSEGRAVPQDYKAAATWYERAAAQGFAPAQYRLGSLYESGNGVDKDLGSAKLWYERAAEAGNRMSMHNLAALYAGGQLGKQQFDSAAKWFEEAADRGLTDSQFNLGMLYARGLGVPQSLEDSYKWFGIAALSGDKDAAKARDDMARSLDADTVGRLNDEIAAFHPEAVDIAANFAPIGTWSKSFDPGETIASKDIVASVQRALDRLGYDAGAPDGIAGPQTATAIKAFEAATGMSQVGQINPRLLAVLGSQPV